MCCTITIIYKCYSWKVHIYSKYCGRDEEEKEQSEKKERARKIEYHGSQRRRTFQERGEAAVSTAAVQQRRMRTEKRPLGL